MLCKYRDGSAFNRIHSKLDFGGLAYSRVVHLVSPTVNPRTSVQCFVHHRCCFMFNSLTVIEVTSIFSTENLLKFIYIN